MSTFEVFVSDSRPDWDCVFYESDQDVSVHSQSVKIDYLEVTGDLIEDKCKDDVTGGYSDEISGTACDTHDETNCTLSRSLTIGEPIVRHNTFSTNSVQDETEHGKANRRTKGTKRGPYKKKSIHRKSKRKVKVVVFNDEYFAGLKRRSKSGSKCKSSRHVTQVKPKKVLQFNLKPVSISITRSPLLDKLALAGVYKVNLTPIPKPSDDCSFKVPPDQDAPEDH